MKLLFTIILFCSQLAHAFEDERILLHPDSTAQKAPEEQNQLNPDQVFERTQMVYKAFGYAPEEDPSPGLRDLQLRSSWQSLQQILAFFDPTGTFSQFMSVSAEQLTWYQDAKSKKVLDSSLSLKPNSKSLHAWSLQGDPSQNISQPLAGLRIALDPGHMGGHTWDVRLGKYIQDGKGRVLSEGLLNLQICLLLKRELESLGAFVFVTHEEIAPVSSVDYEKYDLREWGRQEFFMSSQQDWFVNLLSGSNQADGLKKSFEQSSSYRQLFSEIQRSEYYAKRIDTYARAEVIEKFRPDITLIIHLDTGGDSFAVNPGSPNATKAYVPGGYEKVEFANRELRSYFIRNWVGIERWQGSVRLSHLILQQLHGQMGLGLQTTDGSRSAKVEEGLFARNLVIPRRMKTGVVAYLECLYYDRPQEFAALTNYKYQMQIGNESYPYSDRLVQIVSSLRAGVLDYVQKQH